MRYALLLSYDGTNYSGWQVQKGSTTVQSVLEAALCRVLGQPVCVTASGRTDAGVHAAGQVCHFDATTSIPPTRIADAVNIVLPEDIRVQASCGAEPAFDCNRSAKRKTYVYRMYCARREHPLLDRYAVRVFPAGDWDRMRQAAEAMTGEHDFRAFCASGSSVKTTVRTVYDIRLEKSERYGLPVLELYVTGNGFLYHMVRTIAGTILAVGQGLRSCDDIRTALTSGNRDCLGRTMPAKGLTLLRVEYPTVLFEG